MDRLEINVVTGEQKVVTLTADEEAAALASQSAWAESNTKGARRFIDGLEMTQFRLLLDHENRLRALEGKGQITAHQFRQALIDEYRSP